MFKLFLEISKRFKYLLLIYILTPVIFYMFLLVTKKSLLFVPILNTLILNIPLITIIYLVFQYYQSFYGNRSIYTRTLSQEKWKPYFVFYLFSCLILLIAIFSEQLVFQSLNIHVVDPSKLFPALLKESLYGLSISYLGYLMLVSCLYFAISFGYSNFFDKNRLLWILSALITLIIIGTVLDIAIKSITHSMNTEFLNLILCIICTIASFYLYTKKGVIKS